jgi:hypothetical protein
MTEETLLQEILNKEFQIQTKMKINEWKTSATQRRGNSMSTTSWEISTEMKGDTH